MRNNVSVRNASIGRHTTLSDETVIRHTMTHETITLSIEFDRRSRDEQLLWCWSLPTHVTRFDRSEQLVMAACLPTTTNCYKLVNNSDTSLRSNRTIDDAFTSDRAIDIQKLEGKTTSDHKMLISTIPTSTRDTRIARNTHWRVFYLFCEFVFPARRYRP